MPERRDQQSDRGPDYASLLVMTVVLMAIAFAIGALAVERAAATGARSLAVVVVVCLSPLLFLVLIAAIICFANPRLANFVNRMLGMEDSTPQPPVPATQRRGSHPDYARMLGVLYNTQVSTRPPVPAPQRSDPVPTIDFRPDYASLLAMMVVFTVVSFVLCALAMERVASTNSSLGYVVVACFAPMLLVVPCVVIVYFASPRFADMVNRTFGAFFNGEKSILRPVNPNSTVGKVIRTLDALQDTVKDAMIDLGVPDAAAPKPVPPPPLPEMAQGEFIAVLRPRVDEVLARMAQEINKAPTGNVIDTGMDRVHPLLEELEHEALIQGLRLRIDAAYAALPKERRPQGDWARKYRIMVSG